MASISGCAKANEADLIVQLTPVIVVGDEEDTVAELIEWTRLKGSRVEYPISPSRFREFCKVKSSIDEIWGHAFAYRGNFFRTCSVSQGGDYLYLLPDLAKEKKCRRLGDEVSLEYAQGIVKDSRTDGFYCYLAQFDYGLTLPLSNLAKSVMNLIGACPSQLNCNFWEVILLCKTLNGRWATSGSERRITAKDFLEYYAVKYVTVTDGAYILSSSPRPCFFDLSSTGRVWNDNLLWVSGEYLQRSDEKPLELNNRTITKGVNCKVSRKESFIDVVVREGTELEAVLKELEISWFKRVASKDDKVRRSQAQKRLTGKTPGSMEEKLSTSKLNAPLKLARLNEILDGPVDMATVSSTVVQNLAKKKAIKRGAAPHSILSVSMDDGIKRRKFARALRDVQLGFQDRSMELEKRISQLEGEKNQLEENLTREREAFQLEREKEREAAALKQKEVRAKSEAEAERLVTASAISRNNLTGKLYQLRYTKPEIMAFSKGNFEKIEIMDEEEVEEREDSLNVAERTTADNQETIKQYEDGLDDNVKLSLKLEEAKRQVEQKTTPILSRDLALNKLTSELAKLKEKAASGSRYEPELVEYRIRVLNEEISDMQCNIRALNEQLLKREIELDTARTNLAVSEANFEKLSSSIMGKDRELRNSAQIRDSLIARLDRVKADLHSLKGREAQSRADLVEIQAKNKSLVDDLTHACRNSIDLTRQMSERIDQLTAELAELKAHHLKDNKRTTVIHQAFKEIVVHEQEKCDGEAFASTAIKRIGCIFCRGNKILADRERFDARMLLRKNLCM
ncbi:hypothetical protein GIB67_031399 [Kingdonia uniflora]|uniref:Uncharacterized protein n=1 Tax=Kingdonia uniflora TaxID=39325 RepID=A0A7J7MB20_9MAGN|nr:hypothetical protein GIB67_031399 [Kingdonia uniflora]